MFEIAEAVTQCKFEATDRESDEVVLYKILQVSTPYPPGAPAAFLCKSPERRVRRTGGITLPCPIAVLAFTLREVSEDLCTWGTGSRSRLKLWSCCRA